MSDPGYNPKFQEWITSGGALLDHYHDYWTSGDWFQEFKDWRTNILDAVGQATNPDFEGYESIALPRILFIGLAVLWICCVALAEPLRLKTSKTDFHGIFLFISLVAFFVNLRLFMTPLIVWYAQNKVIRYFALSALDDQAAIVETIFVYSCLRIAGLVQTFMSLVGKDDNPRGRSLKMFHLVFTPARAWIMCKFNPGGPVTVGMMADLTFEVLLAVYWFIERIYRNIFGDASEAFARLVCCLEIFEHLVCFYRLSCVLESHDTTYSFAAMAWLCTYVTYALTGLGLLMAGLLYSCFNVRRPKLSVFQSLKKGVSALNSPHIQLST